LVHPLPIAREAFVCCSELNTRDGVRHRAVGRLANMCSHDTQRKLQRNQRISDFVITVNPSITQEKVKKVLELWIKKGDVYDPAVLNHIKLTYFLENMSDQNGNGMHAAGIPPNGITSNKTVAKLSSRDPRLQLNATGN
jgi:hypothetical protein